MMEIITNNVARKLCALADLPAKVQKDFDYIDWGEEYTPRLVCYKGSWYDVHDTQAITVRKPPKEERAKSGTTGNPYVFDPKTQVASFSPPIIGWGMQVQADSPFAKWDSIISETFFSGVLFRLNNDDMVIVGRYFA
jgi:hypothetical protein